MLRQGIFLLSFLYACSTDGTTGNDASTPIDAGSDVLVDAANVDAPSEAAVDAGPSSYSLTFPAQTLTAPVEQTLCITQHLGNTAALHVGAITTHLDAGDFEIAVYLSKATTEQTTPTTCSALGGLADASLQPIYVGRGTDTTLTFPTGVGITMTANQMITIELHQYAEVSGTAGAKVTFAAMSDGAFQNEAGLFLALAQSIAIGPGAANVAVKGFNAIPAHIGAAKIFSMTGFTNVLGVERQAWNAANASDTSTQVYDSSTAYDQPLTTSFATPLTFAPNAGIGYQCTYTNLSQKTVNQGSSRNDETCMFASYYFPSQGFELCFGSACTP